MLDDLPERVLDSADNLVVNFVFIPNFQYEGVLGGWPLNREEEGLVKIADVIFLSHDLRLVLYFIELTLDICVNCSKHCVVLRKLLRLHNAEANLLVLLSDRRRHHYLLVIHLFRWNTFGICQFYRRVTWTLHRH